jgi:hypothetical protein
MSRRDSRFGGYGSDSLGFDGSSTEQINVKTDDNLAVYVALSTLAKATGDSSGQAAADYASKFVHSVYDPNIGCLLAGTVDECNLNRDYLLLNDQALRSPADLASGGRFVTNRRRRNHLYRRVFLRHHEGITRAATALFASPPPDTSVT